PSTTAAGPAESETAGSDSPRGRSAPASRSAANYQAAPIPSPRGRMSRTHLIDAVVGRVASRAPSHELEKDWLSLQSDVSARAERRALPFMRWLLNFQESLHKTFACCARFLRVSSRL